MEKGSGGSRFFLDIPGLPLRYRLSIPFFFLAFMGTFSLVGLAILSQNELINKEEGERLHGYYRTFQQNLDARGRWAVSLASSFARNPQVTEALANRDRMRLITICYPFYLFMKKHYGVSQFNFHTLPPRNFVRMQRLYEFGDELSYRKTILDAVAHEQETFGLERGITGYGIRGVAPVVFEGKLVGTVEIGFSFGSLFLSDLKNQFSIEASLLFPSADGKGFDSYATTFPESFVRTDPDYFRVFQEDQSAVLLREIAGVPYSTLVGTVQDYRGDTIALVEFCMRRTEALDLIAQYRRVMIGVGILGMLISVAAIYATSKYFTRPIGTMVTFAKDIATGSQVTPMGMRPSGELGGLADALDDMLVSLQHSKKQIRLYTDNLENMVQLRTRALRESEEKYRTLVENVPLVVYRLLGDGRTIFINQFIEELTGVPPQQAMSDAGFWKQKVWEEDRGRIWPLMDQCLRKGVEFQAEYRIMHSSGNFRFVLDHALPVFDEHGEVYTVDGFLLNVTDRHQLQQQIIQTEELRTLTEISARLGHEIRNPLVAAGGFARRILKGLPEGDPLREKAHIIVQEVARLERILQQTLAYLKPFEIAPQKTSLNKLVEELLSENSTWFAGRWVTPRLILAEDLAAISLDQDLFKKALSSILAAMLEHCHADHTLTIRTYPGERVAHLEVCLGGVQLSADDIEHFFYPFTSRSERSGAPDLPMAKMIVHKHQGLIDLRMRDSDQLALDISLPA
jgi:PAS domain S-box-containing protein